MFDMSHAVPTVITVCMFSFIVHLAAESAADDTPTVQILWHDNYAEAMKIAEQQRRMMLIYFCDPGKNEPCNRFKAETLDNAVVCKKLKDYVCVQLPLDAEIRVDGKKIELLKNDAFKEMLGRPGIAILDFVHRDAEYYEYVVSTFPITDKLQYTPERMAVILDLPSGTLTQRTLIYAVRVHPDRPASTAGQIDGNLLVEASSHSNYQAKIALQGHHHWERRFHRINAALPDGLIACEVCAESWPGEHLVEAAVECVRCWRLSDGHWRAVRARHRVYGYDMHRGSNGIWYATGIFGKG